MSLLVLVLINKHKHVLPEAKLETCEQDPVSKFICACLGAGKRGRRNSVGSLDSTIEVSFRWRVNSLTIFHPVIVFKLKQHCMR